MRNYTESYGELIHQTFDFPTYDFNIEDNSLSFNNLNIMELIKKYGTPFKLTYLPKISEKIAEARNLFAKAMKMHNFKGQYQYCYCTKSSHFSFVMEEVLKNGVYLETSSAFDLDIIENLFNSKKVDNDLTILCNGFKNKDYSDKIIKLRKLGFENIIPILDNMAELDYFEKNMPDDLVLNLGIRFATDEDPKFDFYTSRLGIRPKVIMDFFRDKIAGKLKFNLKLLHFFINTGIRDTPYYWREFFEFLHMYGDLRKVCPTLDTIDIGGGFPIKNRLNFSYDYEYMVSEIILNIGIISKEHGVPDPNVFTEFGTYTVGESGAIIFSVQNKKQQNDKELWYMIDGSFITMLPDVWGLGQKYILLAINNWDRPYKRINLGGVTCDSHDYYSFESDKGEIFLPEVTSGSKEKDKQYLGFFFTGAYQESLGGYGGIQHCLVPAPKHVIVKQDEDGSIKDFLFAEEQKSDQMLKTLGYQV